MVAAVHPALNLVAEVEEGEDLQVHRVHQAAPQGLVVLLVVLLEVLLEVARERIQSKAVRSVIHLAPLKTIWNHLENISLTLAFLLVLGIFQQNVTQLLVCMNMHRKYRWKYFQDHIKLKIIFSSTRKERENIVGLHIRS